jgi:hypothetical protein
MNSRNLAVLTVCCLVPSLYFSYKARKLIVSEPAQFPATQFIIEELISLAKQYRKDNEKWPIGQTNILLRFDQETIVKGNASDFLDMLPDWAFVGDSWGTPLFVIVSEDTFTLISAGADREFHTADDITGCFPPDQGKTATNELRDR